MLQAIRSKASSLVVKILFGVLIITFGVWGIGDIFRNRGASTVAATVGDRKIDVQELSQAVRQDAERWRQALRGATLDAEQLKQLGIVDSALQRLIGRELVDLEIRRLRLAVSDEAVDELIRSNRVFQNDKGEFEPQLYQQFVAAQHMTSSQFKASLRGDLLRQQLDGALIDGIAPPSELVDALYRNRAEKRVAEGLVLPSSAAADPGAPSDSDLQDFYDKHQDDFRVPELRGFSLGVLLLDDVAAEITVPDDKLREEYQNRAAEFHAPEERRFEQILLSDEAKAKEAAAQLAQGKDFAEVAHDVAGATADTLDLGFFKKDDLPPSLADPAFALKVGETGQPIEDALGWHILRLAEVKPEETQPFESVKDKLAQEIARDMAADQMEKVRDKVEDALAGGAAFAEVVQRFGLKESKVDSVDANGRGGDGKPVELPASGADILKTAFDTPAGRMSQLNDLGDAGYYVLQVDQVTPAAVKPLDAVKAQVVQLWQQEQRDAALARLAKEIADQATAGRKLADIAAERKLQTFTTAPLTRAGGDPKVPASLVANLFGAKAGAAVFAKGGDGYVVAQVKEVIPADPAKDEKQVAQFSDRLVTPGMRDDMLQEFDKALRQRYPVSIDPAVVARAF
ncbi:MAG TPA: SurA N-terminal domain-containing protein [Stellaceae bacterium]|nr:SurA N-terminal domain-containing protein [Stellaceae bacterium]